MALCSGLVRVSLTTPHAKEMVIRDIKTGELFGDWAAIDGQPRSARVVAIQDSIVALIKKADFQALVTHHPHIALRQMQELTKQLRAMSWRLTEFVAMKANLRVQSVMLDFTVQTPEGLLIQKMAGHQEIAARAFTQREVVAREITALQKEGILLRYNDGFLIPDPERLELLQARKTYKNH
ncbi:cyclic nucleotide-binding domain protein [Microcystis aeruginosa FACHB-905 = DIANCHI905]|nr:cyclic nucleotide-binding domain protein [Microcystis aeruginosa FACHB-905 = DIANCHI905]